MDSSLSFELIDKPAVVPGNRDGGFVQFIAERRGHPLYAVNDLDQAVSGAVMVTATSSSLSLIHI